MQQPRQRETRSRELFEESRHPMPVARAQLKEAFEEHLCQTAQHVERLEQVFDQLGMPVRGKKCEGMKYLIAEGEEMIGEADDDAARDAIMIVASQKVEHYEIASYGTDARAVSRGIHGSQRAPERRGTHQDQLKKGPLVARQ